MKNIYLAGGCFWCIASVFYKRDGIIDVISGYSGGDEINPTYQEVKSQSTGHRETIKIIYDETKISYLDILEDFFNNIDPFDGEGQFVDKGFSYTLAVFYQDDEECLLVEDFLAKKQAKCDKEICISIEKFKVFYAAEEYHQHYSEKHPIEFEKELIDSKRK